MSSTEQEIINVRALIEMAEEAGRRAALEVLRERRESSEDGYKSIKNASKLTDIPEDTIRKWIQRGQIKRYGRGRAVRVKLSEILGVEL